MKLESIVLTIACVLGISIGQILFKKAASSIDYSQSIYLIFWNYWLISALILYGFTTLLWVYILKGTPLSIAYPFMGLAFIFVPLISYFFLDEALRWQTILGGFLILVGLAISAQGEMG